MGVRNPRADLIVHHGVTDVLDQAAKVIHICGTVQEPGDLASPFQWDEILKDIIEFPSKLCMSDLGYRCWWGMNYRLRIFLLASSLILPSGAGELSESASCSTRGIKASMVWRQAIVC